MMAGKHLHSDFRNRTQRGKRGYRRPCDYYQRILFVISGTPLHRRTSPEFDTPRLLGGIQHIITYLSITYYLLPVHRLANPAYFAEKKNAY